MQNDKNSDDIAFKTVIYMIIEKARPMLSTKDGGMLAFFLNNENQTRIFLTSSLAVEVYKRGVQRTPPQEGRFIAATITPDGMMVSYAEFPATGGESIKRATLNYKPFEVGDKAPKHFVDWLESGLVPMADNVVGIIRSSFARAVPTKVGGYVTKLKGPPFLTMRNDPNYDPEMETTMQQAEARGEYSPWKKEED